MRTFVSRGVELALATLGCLVAGQAQTQTRTQTQTIVPSGTHVEVALIRPVWATQVKAGDDLYGQTIFPVTAASGTGLAIPPGSYVLAKILAITKPTRKVPQATLQIQFRKLVLANGYTVPLAADGAAPVTNVTIKVTIANDLILDNGSQVEMTFPTALALDAANVTQAAAISRPPKPGSFTPATHCRFVPGTTGTPGTDIPGTPGTPPTVIPGGPGMPDTVIPGFPATPATHIPGTPDTPDQYCPAPPMVVSSVPVMPHDLAKVSVTSPPTAK